VATRGERRYLQRELARHLKEQDRARLIELRAKIGTAKVNKRAALTAARQQCRSARLDLRDRLKLEREQLRDDHRTRRVKERTACEVGKDTARELGRLEQAGAQRTLREERKLQREVAAADARGRSVRSTARERREESDDAVRSNLPADLVPVFELVKKKIKAGPRRSRTEAFLEWAEENPGEIVAVQQAQADAYLTQLLAEEKSHYKAMRKTGRYKRDADVLRRALSGTADDEAPF
jgi:hypothetical protein